MYIHINSFKSTFIENHIVFSFCPRRVSFKDDYMFSIRSNLPVFSYFVYTTEGACSSPILLLILYNYINHNRLENKVLKKYRK